MHNIIIVDFRGIRSFIQRGNKIICMKRCQFWNTWNWIKCEIETKYEKSHKYELQQRQNVVAIVIAVAKLDLDVIWSMCSFRCLFSPPPPSQLICHVWHVIMICRPIKLNYSVDVKNGSIWQWRNLNRDKMSVFLSLTHILSLSFSLVYVLEWIVKKKIDKNH